ncbi:hypothetical protein HKCCE4037_00080 [Rhodobacterales bacterium HKCCE4037]|nr:hypothetical protein [Rhodobacterales bacterium HKCCE4037]
MPNWAPIRRYRDAADRRRLDLHRSPDGQLYRHRAFFWVDAAPEDEGAIGAGYWTEGGMSGYFSTFAECEQDARGEHSWINARDTRLDAQPDMDEADCGR